MTPIRTHVCDQCGRKLRLRLSAEHYGLKGWHSFTDEDGCQHTKCDECSRPKVDTVLTPCPWYHDEGTIDKAEPQQDVGIGTQVYWIECVGCGARGPISDSANEAANRWNVSLPSRTPGAKETS